MTYPARAGVVPVRIIAQDHGAARIRDLTGQMARRHVATAGAPAARARAGAGRKTRFSGQLRRSGALAGGWRASTARRAGRQTLVVVNMTSYASFHGTPGPKRGGSQPPRGVGDPLCVSRQDRACARGAAGAGGDVCRSGSRRVHGRGAVSAIRRTGSGPGRPGGVPRARRANPRPRRQLLSVALPAATRCSRITGLRRSGAGVAAGGTGLAAARLAQRRPQRRRVAISGAGTTPGRNLRACFLLAGRPDVRRPGPVEGFRCAGAA